MNLFFFRFVFRIAGVIAPPRPPRDAVVDPRIPREIPDAMRLGFGLSARGFGFWCFDFVFFLYTVYPYERDDHVMWYFENRRSARLTTSS